MTAAKRRPFVYPAQEKADRQESLRQVKLDVERLKEKVTKSVIDNPQAAKKAALLISLWIGGKAKTRR